MQHHHQPVAARHLRLPTVLSFQAADFQCNLKHEHQPAPAPTGAPQLSPQLLAAGLEALPKERMCQRATFVTAVAVQRSSGELQPSCQCHVRDHAQHPLQPDMFLKQTRVASLWATNKSKVCTMQTVLFIITPSEDTASRPVGGSTAEKKAFEHGHLADDFFHVEVCFNFTCRMLGFKGGPQGRKQYVRE